MSRRVARDGLVAAVVAILLVAVAMAGYRLSDTTDLHWEAVPAPLDQLSPFQEGRVLVSDVRVAQRIREGDDVSRSPGLYVVVHIAVQATGDSRVTLGDSRLVAGAVSYAPAFSGGDLILADPGFESAKDVVYEVDPTRMAGLTLELWNQGTIYRYYQRSQTPLGITAQNAAHWAAAGRGVEVTVPQSDTVQAVP